MIKKWLTLFMFFVLMIASAGEAFGDETLMYDDGISSGGTYPTRVGDIEAVGFTPVHPCRVTKISIWFTGSSETTGVYIWADYGGGWPDTDWPDPDTDGEPLFAAAVTPNVNEWTEIVIPEGEVVIDPPVNFYAGQLVSGNLMRIAADSSAPESGPYNSKLRIGADWYITDDADLMVRADVEYFDIVEEPVFTDVTESSGLGTSPSRVAWGDYDNDGDDDLLVSGSRLFNNDGGTFTDVSVDSGIRVIEEESEVVQCGGSGGVWADYDNDGYLDFYSTSHGFVPACTPGDGGDWYCNNQSDGEIPQCLDGYCRNEEDPWPKHDCLFHNEGDGTFTVAPEEESPYDFAPTEGAGWGDYDNDGFIDLYVANYEEPGSWAGDSLGRGTTDLLWHNNGDGTFTDVSAESMNPSCRNKSGRGVNWGDYNDDGLIDIFVSVYRLQPNCLWRNNGDGTFSEVAAETGVQGVLISGAYGHTIGSQWMDYDSDGDLDLFSANLAHPRFITFSDKSMLLRNSGPPDYVFTDVRQESGIMYQECHSDPAWGDFDNDGLVDLYITDVYVGQLSELYRQREDNTFEDATYETGTAVDNGWGVAWADMDNDGDLDLVSRSFFRNDTDNDNHWLAVHLEGTDSNRAAIGARVDVTCGGKTQSRQVEGGKGTTNQNSLTLHFGLGDCDMADELTVRWPSGLVETMAGASVDRRLELLEGSMPTAEEEEEEEQDAESAGEPSPDASADTSVDVAQDDEPADDDGDDGGCGCALVR